MHLTESGLEMMGGRIVRPRLPFCCWRLSYLPATSTRSNTLRIGLAEEPRTLNVWLASDANSRKVLSLIYQPLYMYDPETLDLVPWLAESMPVYDPQRIDSYTVTLRDARWSDGTRSPRRMWPLPGV
jgi:ABC-type transport system substrate-binding protein